MRKTDVLELEMIAEKFIERELFLGGLCAAVGGQSEGWIFGLHHLQDLDTSMCHSPL